MTGWRMTSIRMRGGDGVHDLTVELARAGERRTIVMTPPDVEDETGLIEAFDTHAEVDLDVRITWGERRLL